MMVQGFWLNMDQDRSLHARKLGGMDLKKTPEAAAKSAPVVGYFAWWHSPFSPSRFCPVPGLRDPTCHCGSSRNPSFCRFSNLWRRSKGFGCLYPKFPCQSMARLAVKEDPGRFEICQISHPGLAHGFWIWRMNWRCFNMFQLWIQSKILKGPERWVYLEFGRTDWFQDSLRDFGQLFRCTIMYQVSCRCSLKHSQWTSSPISASHSLRSLYPAHGDESTRSPSSGCCKIYLLIKSSNSNSSNNMQQDANTTTATTTTMPIHIKSIWFSIKISLFVKKKKKVS